MIIEASRLLVVSGDADRRERWARAFAEAEADIALYDLASFVPPVARALGARQYQTFVLVAEDDAAGLPAAARRVCSAGIACFGSTL